MKKAPRGSLSKEKNSLELPGLTLEPQKFYVGTVCSL